MSVWILLILALIMSMGILSIYSKIQKYYTGKKTDHFDGSKFYLPGYKSPAYRLTSVMKWMLTSSKQIWPSYVETKKDFPPSRVEGSQLRVSFIGHASFLIQTRGLNIVTDPWWSERPSPVSWFGPKRVSEPGIDFANMPKIDVVLVSHNHYDHLDTATISQIWHRDKPRIIVPLGNEAIIKAFDKGVEVESYDWEDNISLNEEVSVSLDKIQHWSARGFLDKNKALWAAFVIHTPDGGIYFIGDAGYGDGALFREAAEKYSPLRLSIIPVGAFEPRWFMRDAHMNPFESVKTFKDLRTHYAVASHHKTVQLTDEGYSEPSNQLNEALNYAEISEEAFKDIEVGEVFNVPEISWDQIDGSNQENAESKDLSEENSENSKKEALAG